VETRAPARLPEHPLDARLRVRADQPAAVRDLASRFDVEGRSAERNEARFAGGQLVDRCAALVEDRENRRPPYGRRVVAREVVPSRCERLFHVRRRRPRDRPLGALEGASGPRLFPLALHRAVESLAVDGELTLAGEILHEVERDPEGVVQPECLLTGHRCPGRGRAIERLLEAGETRRQHGVESLFLAAHDADDGVAVLSELRIGIGHLGDDNVDEIVEDGF
jgi:hypothetical protein